MSKESASWNAYKCNWAYDLESYRNETNERRKAQIEYNNKYIAAVMSFPREVLLKTIPYSKEELKKMMLEDPLLNNIDFDKSFALLVETEEFKEVKKAHSEFCRKDGEWSEEREKSDMEIAKLRFVVILKQAIRLYVNFSRFTLPND